MILSFSVENYKSVGEKQTLKMTALKNDEHEEILIKSNDLELVSSVAIYGGNNTGKSNLISAMSFIPFLLSFSTKAMPNWKIPVIPFKFSNEYVSKPSSFEVTFIEESIKYVYGFSINPEKVLEEYLYYYPNAKQTLVFERSDNDYKFGTKFKFDDLKEKTIKNKLFLTSAASWNTNETTKSAYTYLAEKFIVNTKNEVNLQWINYTIDKFLEEQGKTKEKILNIMKSVGNEHLSEIIVSKTPATLSAADLPPDLPSELKKMMIENPGFKTEIKINHNYDNNIYQTDISEESEGFNKMFAISGPLADILENGKVLVFDELETSLHPKLLEFIIKLFHDKKTNPNNAQLIFTTHSTEILNLDLFRRDQIYFVEKKDSGMTNLYPLISLKNIKKDENIRKGYLVGKYGDIPSYNINIFLGENNE